VILFGAWFGSITRQSIRRGHFLQCEGAGQADPRLHRPLEYRSRPLVWTTTAEEILAKVRLVQTSVKKLVDNNGKLRHQYHEVLVRWSTRRITGMRASWACQD
jgi:hypothetical protein